MTNPYTFTDNPMISGVSVCNTDIVNDNLMYLKYAVDHIDTSDKADVDLSNLTDTGNIAMANASMTSDTYETLTLSTSGTQYQAPADGWFTLSMKQTQTYNANSIIVLANITKGYGSYIPAPAGYNYTVFLPASKNDTVEAGFTGHAPTVSLRFIYANGSESEAS